MNEQNIPYFAKVIEKLPSISALHKSLFSKKKDYSTIKNAIDEFQLSDEVYTKLLSKLASEIASLSHQLEEIEISLKEDELIASSQIDALSTTPPQKKIFTMGEIFGINEYDSSWYNAYHVDEGFYMDPDVCDPCSESVFLSPDDLVYSEDFEGRQILDARFFGARFYDGKLHCKLMSVSDEGSSEFWDTDKLKTRLSNESLYDEDGMPYVYTHPDTFDLIPLEIRGYENVIDWYHLGDFEFHHWALTCESTQRQALALSIDDKLSIDDFQLIRVSIDEYFSWKRFKQSQNKPVEARTALTKLISHLEVTQRTSDEILVQILGELYLLHYPNQQRYQGGYCLNYLQRIGFSTCFSDYLSEEEITLLNANYAFVVDEVCSSAADYGLGEGCSMHHQSKELSKFCMHILLSQNPDPKYHDVVSVKNPFSGMGDSFSVQHNKDYSIHGYEDNPTALFVSKIRCGYVSNIVSDNNTINDDNPLNHIDGDFVIMTPPTDILDPDNSFFSKNSDDSRAVNDLARKAYKTVDSFALHLALAGNAKHVVCVMPKKFTNSDEYAQLRMELIESQRLRCVILLSSDTVSYSSDDVCIVVLGEKLENPTVKMVNGLSYMVETKFSEKGIFAWEELYKDYFNNLQDCCRDVTCQDIVANNYNVNPLVYFIDCPVDCIKIGDIISPVFIESSRAKQYVSPGDIPFDFIKKEPVPHVGKEEVSVYIVEGPALLASLSGKLRVCKSKSSKVAISTDIFAFRIKDNTIDEDYLLVQLMGNFVKKQFDALSVGNAIQHIRKDDFLNIRVEWTPKEQQLQSVRDYLNSLVGKAEFQIDKQLADFQEELRTRRHNMRTPLKQIKDSMRLLSFSVSEISSSQKNLSDEMLEYLKRQESALNKLSEMISNMDKVVEFPKGEVVSVYELLQSYKGQEDRYFIRCNILPEYRQITIMVDKGALSTCIDLIIDNAKQHGFVDVSRTDYEIKMSMSIERDQNRCVIIIENNGKPLPEGFDQHRYSILGEKGPGSRGEGRGGNYVARMTKAYGGDFSIVSGVENDKANTVVKLIFPINYD